LPSLVSLAGGSSNNLLASGGFRSGFFIPGPTPVLLVGGPGGVYRLINPATAPTAGGYVWTAYGLNLPNVIVTSLDYSNGLLLAGTLGRGARELSGADSTLGTVPDLQITGTGAVETIRLLREQAFPAVLDVFVGSTTSPALRIPVADLQRIDVTGINGNDTLMVDSSNGVIFVPGSIHFNGGGSSGQMVFAPVPPNSAGVVLPPPAAGSEAQGVVYYTNGIQTVFYQNVAQPTTGSSPTPPTPPSEIDLFNDGIQQFFTDSANFDIPSVLAQTLPGIGDTLPDALANVSLTGATPLLDPDAGASTGNAAASPSASGST